MKAVNLENNEVFRKVHDNLRNFFEKTTNSNILEIFYLACQPNEVLKTNDKLLEEFWKNPKNQDSLRQKIIDKYLPKEIYSVNFRNKQLAALTVSKGYILVNKSYVFKNKEKNKGKEFIYMAQLFLIILHEILHKIRLLESLGRSSTPFETSETHRDTPNFTNAHAGRKFFDIMKIPIFVPFIKKKLIAIFKFYIHYEFSSKFLSSCSIEPAFSQESIPPRKIYLQNLQKTKFNSPNY